MKKYLLLFLLSITILIFAEEKISEKKIRIKDNQPYEMIEKLPYSGISSTVAFSSEGQRGYYNIALGFAQIEDFKSALKYAKKIEKQRVKDDCYFKIVLEMIASGLDGKALKTVKKIKEDRYIRQSYSKIIMYIINNNHNYKKAMRYATKYQNENNIKLTKGWIIGDMLKNNKVEDAIGFYKMNVPDKIEKSNIFDTVASTYLYQNDYEGLLDFMKITDIPLNDEYIKVIVRSASRLKKTHLIMNIINSLNNQEKDKEYARIAISFIREYKYPEAYEILTKIQDVENKDRVYLQFAQNYAKDKNVNKALSYADSMSTFKMRDKLYSICSRSYTKFGYIDEAIVLLQKVNDIRVKEKMTSDIASNLFINGEIEKFKEIIITISDVTILDNLYNQIIHKLLRRNQYEQIDECLEKIINNNVKDDALSAVTERYLRSNDFENASKQAEKIINEKTRNKMIDMIKEKE